MSSETSKHITELNKVTARLQAELLSKMGPAALPLVILFTAFKQEVLALDAIYTQIHEASGRNAEAALINEWSTQARINEACATMARQLGEAQQAKRAITHRANQLVYGGDGSQRPVQYEDVDGLDALGELLTSLKHRFPLANREDCDVEKCDQMECGLYDCPEDDKDKRGLLELLERFEDSLNVRASAPVELNTAAEGPVFEIMILDLDASPFPSAGFPFLGQPARGFNPNTLLDLLRDSLER